MKTLFETKKFSPLYLKTIIAANQILNQYHAQGYIVTLRQLYYQFVARDLFPEDRKYSMVNNKWVRDQVAGSKNAEPNYKWLGELLAEARLAGLIDWNLMQDRERSALTPWWCDSPLDALKNAAEGYKLEHWAGQANYVEVMVEKRALEGVLIPVCRDEDVTFTANKGYSSISYMYEAGQRWRDQVLVHGKTVHIVYFGDHDPSGIDMTRDIVDRGGMFADGGREIQSANDIGNYQPLPPGSVNVHRVALNMDQVRELNPPEQPAKLTDSRFKSYMDQFGESCWELDAIEPASLAEIARNKIVEFRDDAIYRKVIAAENEVTDQLMEFANKFGDENFVNAAQTIKELEESLTFEIQRFTSAEAKLKKLRLELKKRDTKPKTKKTTVKKPTKKRKK